MKWYGWLNTNTAREMASTRIHFMEAFVAQAQRELLQDD
jgi:hypothetical protein